MAPTTNELIDKILSDCMACGEFARAQGHEATETNPPGEGLTVGVWFVRKHPIALASGLSKSSARALFNVRLYDRYVELDSSIDLIDPRMTDAVDALFTRWHDNYDFGGTIRNVDVFGEFGDGLDSVSGYVDIGDNHYRVIDITLPLIINDVWTQGGE